MVEDKIPEVTTEMLGELWKKIKLDTTARKWHRYTERKNGFGHYEIETVFCFLNYNSVIQKCNYKDKIQFVT